MTPQVGQKFGPYEILGTLGGGAMGMVFRAWDRRLQREVALKVLQENYQMPGMRERFLLEARAASALNHPNICTIFDMGDQDGDPYLVMELLEGETLKEKIQQGAVPIDELVAYSMEIADALAAAHAKGIVHRDIKPANIFLVDKPNGKSQAKVLDFGLAKIGMTAGGGKAPRVMDLTQAGATVGTLAYMSPEQARGVALDERSDLFSLGVVMYEMATRQVPFQGATSALVFVQLLGNAPEPPQYWNDAIPKELDRIILKLLEKEPRARFQSAVDLHKALEKLIANKPGGWLKKAAAVPLVRAEDPVARQKRPLPKPSGQHEMKKATPAERPGSSPDNMLIRPFRGDATMERLARMEEELSGEPPQSVEESSSVSPPASSSLPKVEIAPPDFQLEDDEARNDARAAAHEVSPYGRMREIDPGDSSALRDALPAEFQGFIERTRVVSGGFWRRSRLIIAALLVLCGVGTYMLLRHVRLTPGLLSSNDALLLTTIQNRTQDATLDGSVMAALEIDLKQSSYLKIRGVEDYVSGLRQVEAEGERGGSPVAARRVAQEVGAKAYLFGEVRQSGETYTISVDMLNAASNDRLVTMVESVPTRDEIPAAIDRLAAAIRWNAGESHRDIVHASISLEQEGSDNLQSLHDYARGESFAGHGRTKDAMQAYQQAVAADPKFAQAQLGLTWLYTAQAAEVAAAESARLAVTATKNSSERVKLLAEFANQLNSEGNYTRAEQIARQLLKLVPNDAAAFTDLARVERLQAHPAEALQAAQQAYAEDPRSAEAYAEAERDMIALNHFDGALELEAQAQRLGVSSGGSGMAAAYLDGRPDLISRQADLLTSTVKNEAQATYGEWEDYALSLDNKGRFASGADLWRNLATATRGTAALASTRSHLLAEAALDRALAGVCKDATIFSGDAMQQAAGPEATFDAAMANALCGDAAWARSQIDELSKRYPRNSAVTGYYVPELRAAVALDGRNTQGALGALTGSSQYDMLSLTPYLRARTHVAAGAASLAIVALQTTLDHRGYAFQGGSNVYPMAQLALSRAYAATGDKANSIAAFQRFQVLWKQADANVATPTH